MKLKRVALKLALGPLPALVATLCYGGAAAAQDDCSTLNLPNPVYGTGGSAFKPTLRQLARALVALPEPVTVLYATPSGCHGVWSQTQPDYVITQTLSYWDADGTEHTCSPGLAGIPADFGNQFNSHQTCENVGDLTGVGDFKGSVGTFNFVVNPASSQTSISAEALYYIYGFGADSQVSPWTNATNIISRPAVSAASILVGLLAGVPPTAFQGAEVPNNVDVLNALAALSGTEAIESGIGFVSGNYADTQRAAIRTLALQAKDQHCAYWPDSTPEALDKQNVRDGHYALWAQNHFYAKVDETGTIINENVRNIVGYIAGTVQPPAGVNIAEIEITTGNIPVCAMRVSRTEDLGPQASFANPAIEGIESSGSCSCFFDAVATGSTDCETCSETTPCSGDAVCRRGYCEAF